MANFVRVDIVCPCGKLISYRNNNADSRSTSRGTVNCPACKRKVEYAITGPNCYTNYR